MTFPYTTQRTITAGHQTAVAFVVGAVTGLDWEAQTWLCEVRDIPGGYLIATPEVLVANYPDGSAIVYAVVQGSVTRTIPWSCRIELLVYKTAPQFGPLYLRRVDVKIEKATALVP